MTTSPIPMGPARAQASRFFGPEGPSEADLGLCVHCGFCLNACPTYLELGVEMDSPRGRIVLMRALDTGRVAPTARVLQHFDQCLACRACETACPSGVPYGRLIETTRADLFLRRGRAHGWRERPRERLRRWGWTVVMRGIFPHPARLRIVFAGLRFYQRTGLQGLLRRSGLLRRLAPRLADLDALAPDASGPVFQPADVGRYTPAGRPRARAAMLTGCVMPLTFPATHHATARVLARNGIALTPAAGQICCGALHGHAGDVETARRLARHNIDAFLAEDPEVIIVNAAGCGSQMKAYGHLLRDDPAYAAKAAAFSARVRDLLEYLDAIGIEAPRGAIHRIVTYQDSCHLAHAQQVTAAPRALLRLIPGLELREMEHPDRCCGSAGIYSIIQPGLSRTILAGKMAEIAATGAEQVCTANPGCMVQLDAGLRLFGPGGRSVHVVDLLDESYRAAEGDGYADRR